MSSELQLSQLKAYHANVCLGPLVECLLRFVPDGFIFVLFDVVQLQQHVFIHLDGRAQRSEEVVGYGVYQNVGDLLFQPGLLQTVDYADFLEDEKNLLVIVQLDLVELNESLWFENLEEDLLTVAHRMHFEVVHLLANEVVHELDFTSVLARPLVVLALHCLVYLILMHHHFELDSPE